MPWSSKVEIRKVKRPCFVKPSHGIGAGDPWLLRASTSTVQRARAWIASKSGWPHRCSAWPQPEALRLITICKLTEASNGLLVSWRIWDCPSPPSLPSCWWIQFEELLKRFPVQALDWANTLTNQHTRDNLARVIFVCNSDAGSQSLLNLNQGTRFDRVIMEPVSGEDEMDLNKELFQNCSGNIGMYKLGGVSRIKRQELTEEQVEDFIRATFHRWELDFHLPYPVKYDRSWAEMDVELMRERMEEFLEQALRAREKDGNKVFTEEQIKLQMGFAKGTWKDPNQQQILDASEELWLERLESVGADKPVAEALASQIKGMICSPVPKRWGCSVSPCVYLYSWRDLKLPRLKGLCCFADVQLCHVNLAFLIVPYFLCGIA